MSTTPDQLVFKLQARRRVIDSMPPDKFQLQFDDFLTETYESSGQSTTAGGYLPFGASPTSGGSWGLAGNSTFGISAGAGGFNSYFDTRARLPGPYGYVEVGVATSATNLSIGFTSTNGTDYILGQINGSGNFAIVSSINGASASVTSTVAAGSNPIFRMVLTYPECWLYQQTPQGWIPVCFVYLGGVGSSDDLRISSVWSTWAPVFGGNLAANASVTFDYIKVGMPPAYGSRDYKPIINKDTNAPLQIEGRYYFTMTAAIGQDFNTNHQTIISIDPYACDPRIESHIFYNINVSGVAYTTSLFGGQIVYEPATGNFYCFPNSWGFSSTSAGVDEWLAVTKKYILGGVHVLNAKLLALPNSTTHSHYDGSLRWDASQGAWVMACIETNARTNWTGNYPAIYTSTDLYTWLEGVPYSIDSALKIDGTTWFRMSGVWYVSAGGNDALHVYTYNNSNQSLAPIANLATLQTNWQNFLGVPVIFTSFVPHCPMLPIYSDGVTQWMYLTYDSSLSSPTVAGGYGSASTPATPGTCGAMVIMRATTTVPGDEFLLESPIGTLTSTAIPTAA